MRAPPPSPAAAAARPTVIATYREGSLHAALTERYARTMCGGRMEAIVEGFIVDVAADDGLAEVQTGSFASARRKLERLLERHRLVLVHPIPVEKWLVRLDSDGLVVARRRSPRRGQPLDLFDELVHLPTLIAHPSFRIDLVLTREEEVRGPVPAGSRFRHPREWSRLDRRLLDVLETQTIEGPGDLLDLLPAGLPDPFTTADLVAASGRSKRLAMRTVYCLARVGVVRRTGKVGRHAAWSPVSDPFEPG